MDTLLDKKSIGLLYLGSKGAGVKFLELLSQELSSNYETHIYVRSDVDFLLPRSAHVHSLALPKSRIMLLLGVQKHRVLKRIIESVKESQIDGVIIPMAHPWDLFFEPTLLEIGIKVVRIIHDPKKHPGDVFPTNKQIRSLCKSKVLITLSSYTANEIGRFTNSRIISSVHPFLPYLDSRRNSAFTANHESYDLIIGRQKRYQNVFAAVKWWLQLPSPLKQNRYLLVAGKLNFLLRTFMKLKKVKVHSGWVSEKDFVDLIRNANRVLCLYKEASQSGVISIAQQFGIPVLATNVGGLSEQLDTLGGGLIVPVNDKNDWLSGYAELNNRGRDTKPVLNPTQVFVRDVDFGLRLALLS
jgi:glycosyltransferase involved in cell wall biosynthesis